LVIINKIKGKLFLVEGSASETNCGWKEASNCFTIITLNQDQEGIGIRKRLPKFGIITIYIEIFATCKITLIQGEFRCEKDRWKIF